MDRRRVGVLRGADVRLVDPATPVFTAFDLAPTRGDGAFESVLVQDGEPRWLDAHLRRLAESTRRLELTGPTEADWRRLIAAVLAAPDEGEAVLKLLVSRGIEGGEGCTALATRSPLPAEVLRQRRSGIAVLSLSLGWAAGTRAQAPWLLGGVKSLSYAMNMAAVRHARAQGADDVVFCSTDDRLLEGPTSTVIWARGTTLCTPPTSTGILPGTTQQTLFAAAPAAGLSTRTEDGTVADLQAADGVWLVSSIRGVAEVIALDGRARPPAALSPLLRQLVAIT